MELYKFAYVSISPCLIVWHSAREVSVFVPDFGSVAWEQLEFTVFEHNFEIVWECNCFSDSGFLAGDYDVAVMTDVRKRTSGLLGSNDDWHALADLQALLSEEVDLGDYWIHEDPEPSPTVQVELWMEDEFM